MDHNILKIPIILLRQEKASNWHKARYSTIRWMPTTIPVFSLYVLHIHFLVNIKYLCITYIQDDDPYVRKTAAICVAKLYDINAELVEDRGFLENLKDLISDNNPMVVANAVAALAEIQENSARPIFEMTSHTLSKLLTALNECTE
jgi:vesicle coat complex subunit